MLDRASTRGPLDAAERAYVVPLAHAYTSVCSEHITVRWNVLSNTYPMARVHEMRWHLMLVRFTAFFVVLHAPTPAAAAAPASLAWLIVSTTHKPKQRLPVCLDASKASSSGGGAISASWVKSTESDAIARVQAASKAGERRRVRVLIDDLLKRQPPRKLWSYNTLITACGRAGLTDLAKQLFQVSIASAGLTPNDHTFSAYAKAAGDWREALRMLQEYSGDSAYVTNAVLATLRDAQRPREAMRVLFSPSYPRDAVSYTIAMSIKGVDGRVAWTLLQRMRHENIQADDRAYAAAIAACAREPKRPDLGVQIYDTMPTTARTEYACSAAISLASATDAQRIFQSLSAPSDYCRTAVITACGREGKWREAIEYVIEPVSSEAVVRSAIWACERASCDEAAIAAARLFRKVRLARKSLELATVNAAISALGAGGRVSAALTVFNELRSRDSLCPTGPDADSFTAAIAACATAARWRDALLLLAEMRLEGLDISTAAIGAALVACQRGGASSQAASVLRAARRRRLPLDTSCYDAAILAQAHSKSWKTAIALFRECRRASKLEPARRTYVALLEVLHVAKQPQRADIVYYAARSRGKLSHAHPEGPNTIDLHEFSRAASATALRAALREANPSQDLQIVVGKGLHTQSDREPILADFIRSKLLTEHKLEAIQHARNAGRLVVTARALQDWRSTASLTRIPPAAWRLAPNTPLLAHPALLLGSSKLSEMAAQDDDLLSGVADLATAVRSVNLLEKQDDPNGR